MRDGQAPWRNNHEYLALVEAVRVEGKNTHRTLFCLGEVSEQRSQANWTALSRRSPPMRREVEAVDTVAATWSYFAGLVLRSTSPLWATPPFSQVLSDTVFTMVANRRRAIHQARDDN